MKNYKYYLLLAYEIASSMNGMQKHILCHCRCPRFPHFAFLIDDYSREIYVIIDASNPKFQYLLLIYSKIMLVFLVQYLYSTKTYNFVCILQ